MRAFILVALANPIVFSTVGGLVHAAAKDYLLYREAKTLDEFRTSFHLDVALWQWTQGAFTGFVTGVGLWLAAVGVKAL